MREMAGVLDKNGLHHAGAGEDLGDAGQIAIIKMPNGVRVGLYSALAFLGDGASCASQTCPL